MRAHGVLSEIPGAGTTDHVCWVYDDDAAFDRAVEAFLAGGLQRGERLLCVGERAIAGLTGLPQDIGPLLASGAVQTQTLAQAYEAAGPFDPATQLAYYEAATQRALDDGYRGLRVIAEISTLAADPATRSELVRWEHVADEFISRAAGFTAMCAYTDALSDEALADVASVHPLVHTPEGLPPFRVFFEDDHLALAGSLDGCGAERLSRVLGSSPVGRRGPVLDLRLVEFVDVAASRAVARWAQGLAAQGATLEIRGASPLLRRMWRILALDVLAPVTFTGAVA